MKRMVSVLIVMGALFLANVSAKAAMHTEDVLYKHGDVELLGYIAYDDSISGPRPGVLIVHEWTGLGDYLKRRARQIAELGYVAFAIDIYGKGIRPQNREEASQQATIYRSDRALMRARAQAGLTKLKTFPFVDPRKIAAMGYCFGGGVVLELARSGADVVAVVSFHGNLDTPDQSDAKNIKSKVLVLHGADDPHVSPEQVATFQKEMREAGVDWQLISYSNAVHSFTNPDSGDDATKGAAYNRKADMRSWQALTAFLKEVFE